MMLTAASNDKSWLDLDRFISVKSLITTSRKRKERLLSKISSAWKSRKSSKVEGKNTNGKALRLARIEAKSKHFNKITSFIDKLRDEVQHLKSKEKRYKNLELERKARFLFNKKPFLKTVENVFHKVKKATVLEKDCIQFYKMLYSKPMKVATPEVDK